MKPTAMSQSSRWKGKSSPQATIIAGELPKRSPLSVKSLLWSPEKDDRGKSELRIWILRLLFLRKWDVTATRFTNFANLMRKPCAKSTETLKTPSLPADGFFLAVILWAWMAIMFFRFGSRFVLQNI